MATDVSPEPILGLGLGFWGSKTLLSAIELGLFTELARAPADANGLAKRLGLHERAARDFFDALVALGMLERNGSQYANTPATNLFLDRAKPSYVGGMLEMANARLYGYWGSLTEALKTGQPQNESKSGGDMFTALYSDPNGLRGFLKAMTGISMGAARMIAERFPWQKYRTFIDVGCAEGAVPVAVAQAHKELTGGGFDLPQVRPHFEAFVAAHGLSDRLRFHPGNFFKDELPQVDVIVMGHILHDWNLEEKQALLSKVYKALPKGGAVVAYDAIIDDDRRKNAFGLLMSLNMLIETSGGFDYTGADCMSWMRAAGFSETRVEHLLGPDSMVIGIK